MSLMVLAWIIGPGVLGAMMHWFATRCKGKNARDFSRLAGWGFLLLYLRYFAFVIPIPFLNYLIMLVPSALCFLFAFNAIVREMRAQKNGEFTEAA